MKNNNIIQISTAKNLESKLDLALAENRGKLPVDIFPSFKSVLSDEKKLINWDCDVSNSTYTGFKLEYGVLTKLPPFEIPKLQNSIRELLDYKTKIEAALTPLRDKTASSDHKKLFEQEILNLINCYPTYGKKDDDFKQTTISSFLIFFEEFPVTTFSRAVREWIKTEPKFPEVSKLRSLIKKKLFLAERKLRHINKIIEKSTN